MGSLSLFPGVIAQEVSPNPKCNGCLHYHSNGGTSGVCQVGLRPWLCGEGDNQIAGYSPLAGQKPTDPGDMAEGGHAASDIAQQVVPMSLTVLGDEHAELTKSIHDELQAIERKVCPFHQNSTHANKSYAHVEDPTCNCKRIASKSIARRLYKSLQNNERVHVTEDDVLFFVRGVRKGMGVFDIARSRLYEGVEEPIAKSVGDREVGITLGQNNDLAKSLYGDDWTTQFIGTDLFDDASKLREQEIDACEAELKARIERIKKQREAPKMAYDNDGYENRYAADEKLRIAKARLMLKLQKHRNKQMSPKSANVAKSDINKSINWSHNDHGKPGKISDHTGTASHGHYRILNTTHGQTDASHEHGMTYVPKGKSKGTKTVFGSLTSLKQQVATHHAKMSKGQ